MHLTKIRIDADRFPTNRLYPFNIPILNTTTELTFNRRVVFFVGENGSGKSTLLEAVSRKCGIHIWDKPRRHVAHNNPFETRLAEYVTVTWSEGTVSGSLFRAETFHEFADFLDDVALCDPGRLEYHGGRILNTLSHGEAILSYFSNRFHVRGLYFLDEPESALSPSRQLQFLNLLQQLEAEGHAQFIMATHSPLLLAYPGAQIFSFDSPRIEEVDYEDTTHYKLYKQFFIDRTVFLENGESSPVSEERGDATHESRRHSSVGLTN
ncbi:MAG: DNA replication and repair protein RecF [Anaerolineales bacterium]|nr:DNA replication and repair protein RecF [Anaerolineales bacterium]